MQWLHAAAVVVLLAACGGTISARESQEALAEFERIMGGRNLSGPASRLAWVAPPCVVRSGGLSMPAEVGRLLSESFKTHGLDATAPVIAPDQYVYPAIRRRVCAANPQVTACTATDRIECVLAPALGGGRLAVLQCFYGTSTDTGTRIASDADVDRAGEAVDAVTRAVCGHLGGRP